MTELIDLVEAGVADVPAETWLRAGDTLAGFTPSEGFNCVALRVHRAGRWEPMLAEPPSLEALRARPAFYGSPLLGPYVFGLREGAFTFDGQRYVIKPGRDQRVSHGLTRDYAWTTTEARQTRDEARLRAHLDIGAGDPASDARLAQFPFPIRFDVTYVLRPRILITRWEVTNLGTSSLPLGVGIHPYFRLPFRPGGYVGDLVARGNMARVPGDSGYHISSGSGGHEEGRDAYAQRVDRYLASVSPGERILDLFERTDQQGPSDSEGAGEPLWSLTDEAADLAISIRANSAFKYVLQFVPGNRTVLSPVVSTNRSDAFNLSAQGLDSGMITLGAGDRWQGWCTMNVNDLSS